MNGISLYLQGTQHLYLVYPSNSRYIPVPTGNSQHSIQSKSMISVYPCTYRELRLPIDIGFSKYGISLYLQGTLIGFKNEIDSTRYIPVPTGNSRPNDFPAFRASVYPCTYRELIYINTVAKLGNRYIPVPTGNSLSFLAHLSAFPVYPCTYRELHPN